MKKVTIRPPSQSEEAAKKVCLRRLAEDRRQLMVKWPFIGGIIMRMELVPVRDSRLATASTDGDNIFIDIAFYSKLSHENCLFVLAHEVWHSVLLHFARRQNRDHELFNIAADLEIHFTLQEEGMDEPFVLPHNERWRTLSAEEIYERLPNFLKNYSAKQKSKNNVFGDGTTSFDKHIYQGDSISEPEAFADDSGEKDNNQDGNAGAGDGAESQSNQFAQDGDERNAGDSAGAAGQPNQKDQTGDEENASAGAGAVDQSNQKGQKESEAIAGTRAGAVAQSKQNTQAGDETNADASADVAAQPKQKKQKGGKRSAGAASQPNQKDQADDEENVLVIDKDYAPAVSREAVERSRSRTIASAIQVERTQGKLPGNIQAILDKLRTPSLPWQEMLKQFVTTCYGGKRRWLPPARRHVWQDLYLPSMRDEALKAVVALDTSGSTTGDLPVFFGELVSLMKSFGKFDLDVIQCDAEIQKVEHYSEVNVPAADKQWQVMGHGGTDFRPVFDYIRKNMREQPDLLLFFTDGYGKAPEQRPPYPVMWVLTHHGNVPAEWGRVAHLH